MAGPRPTVPITDRGYAYGDGLFETIAIRAGAPQRLPAHLDRLCTGCQRLGLAVPDRGELELAVARAAPATGDAVVRLTVTRAGQGRGYRPPAEAAVAVHALAFELPEEDPNTWRAGIELPILPVRLPVDPLLAGIKHRNRLHQVLASSALGEDQREGLMLDSHGRVVEGTRSNVFVVVGGRVLTPRVDSAGVSGILRGAVLDWLVHAGIPSEEADLFPCDLARADEVFLTNSVLGVWPVRQFLGPPAAELPVGPLAFKVRTALFEPTL